MKIDWEPEETWRICKKLTEAGYLEKMSADGEVFGGAINFVTEGLTVVALKSLKVSLFEIAMASGEDLKTTMCSKKSGEFPCGRRIDKLKCNVHDILRGMNLVLEKYMRSITLEDIVNNIDSATNRYEAFIKEKIETEAV